MVYDLVPVNMLMVWDADTIQGLFFLGKNSVIFVNVYFSHTVLIRHTVPFDTSQWADSPQMGDSHRRVHRELKSASEVTLLSTWWVLPRTMILNPRYGSVW